MTAPTPRNFNNTAVKSTLTLPIAPTSTGIAVDAVTNYPSAPFVVTIDRNTDAEEIVLITAVAGLALTAVRGYDGTTAQAHIAGASVEHTAVALDFREANQHTNATSGVHGVAGALVGVSDTQTLGNKTLFAGKHVADVTAGDAITATAVSGRNIFNGKRADGTTVTVIDQNGNVLAPSVHTTGAAVLDGNVQAGAALSVAGTSTLATTNVVGNLGVTGNANVSGGVTVTGAVGAASVGLAPQASDPASGLFVSTANGVSWRPVGGVTRRLGAAWGAATTFPTTPLSGDTFYHSGVGCTYVYSGVAWRQVDEPIVANDGAMNAISGTYLSAIYKGFQVYNTARSCVMEYQSTTTGWTRPWGEPWGDVLTSTAAGVGQNNNTINIGKGAASNHFETTGVQFYANRKYRFDINVFAYCSNTVGRYSFNFAPQVSDTAGTTQVHAPNPRSVLHGNLGRFDFIDASMFSWWIPGQNYTNLRVRVIAYTTFTGSENIYFDPAQAQAFALADLGPTGTSL